MIGALVGRVGKTALDDLGKKFVAQGHFGGDCRGEVAPGGLIEVQTRRQAGAEAIGCPLASWRQSDSIVSRQGRLVVIRSDVTLQAASTSRTEAP